MLKIYSFLFIFGIIAAVKAINGQTLKLPCTDDKQCQDLFKGSSSKCVDKHCICLSGSEYTVEACGHPVLTQTNKKVDPLVGRHCKNETECALTHGVCDRESLQCKCEDGFVETQNRTECVPVAEGLGHKCENNEQCSKAVGYSNCVDGLCKCEKGYRRVTDKLCLKNVGDSKSCSKDEDCQHIEKAKCLKEDGESSGSCECGQSMGMNSGLTKCLDIVGKLAERCVENIQCSGIRDSECIESVCECKQGYHLVEKKLACVADKALDDNCTPSEGSCYQKAGNNDNALKCSTSNKCECNDKFKLEDGICISSGASSIFNKFSMAFVIIISVILVN